jgi:hypothetical protein
MYVIIEGYYDKNDNGELDGAPIYEDVVGITESVEEAYGIAYLTLSDSIMDNDQEGETVTIQVPNWHTENDDEWVIYTSSNQKNIQDFCKIFALKDCSAMDRLNRHIHRYGSKEINN